MFARIEASFRQRGRLSSVSSIPSMPISPERGSTKSEHLESLERGLAVLALFGRDGRHSMTMIEVAEALDLPRSVARRVLLTLERLAYVYCDDGAYSLAPRVLTLGYAYLSSLGFRAVAKPILDSLVALTGQTCSIGVLDRGDVVYVLRAEARRLVRIDLTVGSRIPAWANSMGRVLLGGLPDREIDAYLRRTEIKQFTRHTVTQRPALRETILRTREQGWCYIAHEVEEGICGLATPLHDRDGRIVAALNLSLAFQIPSQKEIRQTLVPLLLAKSRAIEAIVHSDMSPDGAPRRSH